MEQHNLWLHRCMSLVLLLFYKSMSKYHSGKATIPMASLMWYMNSCSLIFH